MTLRAMGIGAACAAVLAIMLPCWSAEKDQPAAQVVRYVGCKTGTAWGRPAMILVVAPRSGGGSAELVVPNKDPMAMKLDPSQAVVDLVKTLKQGDLIEVKAAPFQGLTMLNSIAKYEPKPGEDDPNCFAFVKVNEGKVGAQDTLSVTLKKDEKTVTVPIPNRKDKDGKVAPDEALASAAKGFKDGDLVEVRVAGNVLKLIAPYKPAEKAEFVKTGEQKVGDVAYMTVELKKDDLPVILLIPAVKNDSGSLVRDAELVAKAKALRAGFMVEYKTRSDAGQTYLLDIKSTGEKATSKPADKK